MFLIHTNFCFINFKFFGRTNKFGFEQNNLETINRPPIAGNTQFTHPLLLTCTNNYPYRLYIPSLLWIMDLHPKT